MERIKMAGPKNLPPGFRFHPTDQELIIHYLKNKVSSPSNPLLTIIADIDLYKFNPWELPGKAVFGETEWFFFSPRDRKYPNGARPNRAAGSGYWKATGTDKPILSSDGLQCLGVKKALVFYKRVPKGTKTDWVMHEYRLLLDDASLQRLRGSTRLDDWVLCRVHQKSNFPREIGENCKSIYSNKTSFSLQRSKHELNKKKTPPLEDCDYQFDSYPMTPQGSGVVDGGEKLYMDFQGGPSTQINPDINSQSYDAKVSPLKATLESLKRTLSVGSLDEELLPRSPKRSVINHSTSHNNCSSNVFQIPSPIDPDPMPPCFSESIF